MIKSILLVAIGGAFGSVLRFLTSIITNKFTSEYKMIGTFVVNIIGCLLIGYLTGYLTKILISNDYLKFLLITGFCGGFTTFSAFSIETYNLIIQQNYIQAILYILASVLIGLLAVWLGVFISKTI